MKCGKCGSKVSDNAGFCGKCGNPVNQEQKRPSADSVKTQIHTDDNAAYVEPKKSNTALKVLAIFAGIVVTGGVGLFLYITVLPDFLGGSATPPASPAFIPVSNVLPASEPEEEPVVELVLTAQQLAELEELGDSIDKMEQKPFMSELTDGSLIYREYTTGDRYINYDHTTRTIYPGAIIKGDSLFEDSYNLLIADRAPLELKLGSNRAVVSEPNEFNVTEEVSKLVKMGTEDSPSDVAYHAIKIESGNSLDVGLNAGVGFKGIGVELDGGFSSSNKSTNMVVTYRKIHYYVDAAVPANPQDFFRTAPELSQLGDYAPAYVAQVGYGKIGFMTISTNESEQAVRAALGASIPALLDSASAKISAEHSTTLNQSEIQWSVYGSDAEAGDMGTGWEGFFNAMEGTGTAGTNKAVPLAYKLNYLSDNSEVPVRSIVKEMTLSEDAVKIDLEWTNVSTFDEVEGELTFHDLEHVLLSENKFYSKDTKIQKNKISFVAHNLRPASRIDIHMDRSGKNWYGDSKGWLYSFPVYFSESIFTDPDRFGVDIFLNSHVSDIYKSFEDSRSVAEKLTAIDPAISFSFTASTVTLKAQAMADDQQSEEEDPQAQLADTQVLDEQRKAAIERMQVEINETEYDAIMAQGDESMSRAAVAILNAIPPEGQEMFLDDLSGHLKYATQRFQNMMLLTFIHPQAFFYSEEIAALYPEDLTVVFDMAMGEILKMKELKEDLIQNDKVGVSLETKKYLQGFGDLSELTTADKVIAICYVESILFGE